MDIKVCPMSVWRHEKYVNRFCYRNIHQNVTEDPNLVFYLSMFKNRKLGMNNIIEKVVCLDEKHLDSYDADKFTSRWHELEENE